MLCSSKTTAHYRTTDLHIYSWRISTNDESMKKYEIEGEYLNYPDIFRRVGTNDAFKKFIYLDRYHIDDGERIEEVANAIYGSPEYHWVIVITNDIVDPIHEWPLSTTDLIKYCQ